MDRLSLPNDRREACRACGSEKREYLTECAVCETAICSECRTEDGDDDLCSDCALRELNIQLAMLVPACTCEYPAWSHYGQQFEFGVR